MTKTLAAMIAALILTVASADARTRHQTPNETVSTFDRHGGGYASIDVVRVKPEARQHRHRDFIKPPTGYREVRVAKHRGAASTMREAKLLPHPQGCPHRAFCGCGTSLYLLGKRVAEGGLAIARNWLDFPRASCAPGMAAARRGHVFAIIECLGHGEVMAYDPNAGGHRTMIHRRSLAGFTIVNPHKA